MEQQSQDKPTISYKGLNYGKYHLNEEDFEMEFEGKQIIRIPFCDIVNSTVQQRQKTEVNIELNTDDHQPRHDNLCSIRFYVPKHKESKKMDTKIIETEAHILNDQLNKKAQLGKDAGSIIATLPSIKFIIPRAKQQIEMFEKQFRLHGTTYDYIVKYKHIWRAFMLPNPNAQLMNFVIALNKPILKGTTHYQFLVMEIEKDWKEEVKITCSEEIRNKISNGQLKEKYSSSICNTVARLFKFLAGINIVIPGNFKSSVNRECVMATVKANQGNLYFLNKSLLYLFKPVLFIPLNKIKKVIFHRVGLRITSRYFEIEIFHSNHQRNNFVGIDTSEVACLRRYFESNEINLKVIDEDDNEKTFAQLENQQKGMGGDDNYDSEEDGSYHMSQDGQDEESKEDFQGGEEEEGKDNSVDEFYDQALKDQ